MTLELSVVVPCFNEADCLTTLHDRLTAACRRAVGSFEIIYVDDGSRDATWTMLQDLARTETEVVAVSLSRNHGHQLALAAGLKLAAGARVFIIDADLQDPPELLTEMMRTMDGGADVVYGQRRSRAGETLFKRLTAGLFYRLFSKLTDIDIPLDAGDFRLISRRVLDVLLSMPEHYRFTRGLVAWAGFRQVPVYYDRAERYAGETKYPLKRMMTFAIDAITGFSIRPLRLATYAGFLSSFGAFLMILFVLFEWFHENTIRGWSSTLTIILILNAVQFFLMSMFGEYLGRTFMEAKNRPLFIIGAIALHPDADREEVSARLTSPPPPIAAHIFTPEGRSTGSTDETPDA